MISTAEKKKLYKAILSRDPRHDGRFYFAVTSTGIYCRPICSAKPKFENVEFFQNKFAAENAGYRPCLRCRPDLSLLSPQWSGTAAIIPRALNLIEQADLENEDLNSVAVKLGMSDRHLRRLFQEHLGTTPVNFAISRRLHLARQLLSETKMSMTDVAVAAGFGSLRRFNDAFLKTYKSTPKNFRLNNSNQKINSNALILYLSYVAPYDWNYQFNFFRSHEIYGSEAADNESLHRFVKTKNGINYLKISNDTDRSALRVEVQLASPNDLRYLIDQIKMQFDLKHNPYHIALPSKSKNSTAFFKDLKAIRIPGAFDPFAVAISIILGQLVSVEQAKQNIKKLVLKLGSKIDDSVYVFPSPEQLKDADFSQLGFTKARANAIKELSQKVYSQEIILSANCDLQKTREQLLAIKGIGPWTVEMIALRCLNDPNAFPAKDLIIQRALQKFKIDHEAIEPWRSYLTLAIWKSQAHILTKKRKKPKHEK